MQNKTWKNGTHDDCLRMPTPVTCANCRMQIRNVCCICLLKVIKFPSNVNRWRKPKMKETLTLLTFWRFCVFTLRHCCFYFLSADAFRQLLRLAFWYSEHFVAAAKQIHHKRAENYVRQELLYSTSELPELLTWRWRFACCLAVAVRQMSHLTFNLHRSLRVEMNILVRKRIVCPKSRWLGRLKFVLAIGDLLAIHWLLYACLSLLLVWQQLLNFTPLSLRHHTIQLFMFTCGSVTKI